MHTGAITDSFDVAQLTLYVFWLFFAGLIFYLRREDKREGYPLLPDSTGTGHQEGFPPVPPAKTFRLSNGTTVLAPRAEPRRIPQLVAGADFPGAPLVPTGNPMIDGVGTASYADREDVPEMEGDTVPKILPLRLATDYWVAAEDSDPRGWAVLGDDGLAVGIVADIWVDRSEMIIRYLEVALAGSATSVLLPMTATALSRAAREVRVSAILGSQFADVPKLRNPNQITLLEEDRITGYYAGGYLYATPDRAEPFL